METNKSNFLINEKKSSDTTVNLSHNFKEPYKESFVDLCLSVTDSFYQPHYIASSTKDSFDLCPGNVSNALTLKKNCTLSIKDKDYHGTDTTADPLSLPLTRIEEKEFDLTLNCGSEEIIDPLRSHDSASSVETAIPQSNQLDSNIYLEELTSIHNETSSEDVIDMTVTSPSACVSYQSNQFENVADPLNVSLPIDVYNSEISVINYSAVDEINNSSPIPINVGGDFIKTGESNDEVVDSSEVNICDNIIKHASDSSFMICRSDSEDTNEPITPRTTGKFVSKAQLNNTNDKANEGVIGSETECDNNLSKELTECEVNNLTKSLKMTSETFNEELDILEHCDDSTIGSLLMLSTELEDSFLRRDKNDFDSRKGYNRCSSTLQKQNESCSETRGRPKKLNLNSISAIDDSLKKLSESGIYTNESAQDEVDQLSVMFKDNDMSLSFSNYEKWLPSLKNQLKQLLEYIKHMQSTNCNLEFEVEELKKIKLSTGVASETVKANGTELIKEELQSVKNENDYLKDKVQSLSKDIEDFKNTEDTYKKKLIEYEGGIGNLHSQISKMEHIKNDYDTLKISYQLEKDKVRNSDIGMQDLLSKYELLKECNEKLKSDLNVAQSEISNLKNKINEEQCLKKECESLEIKNKELVCKIDHLNSHLHELESANKDYKWLQKTHAVAEITLQQNLVEIADLKSKLNVAQCLLDKSERQSVSVCDELKEKCSRLQCECESLKETLDLTESKLACLQENNNKMDAVTAENKFLQIEISNLKHKLDEYNVETNKVIDINSKYEDEVKGMASKLELYRSENDELKNDLHDNVKVLGRLLNVETDITFNELVEKLQKQFYNFTLVEEKVERSKIMSCEMKNENCLLKEQNKLLKEDIERFEREIQGSVDNNCSVKDTMEDLETDSHQGCLNDSREKLRNIKLDYRNLRELKEKYESVIVNLNHHLVIQSDSCETTVDTVLHLLSENEKNKEVIRILREQCVFVEKLNIFSEIICKIEQIQDHLKVVIGSIDLNNIDEMNTHISLIDELLKQCSSLKQDNNSYFLNDAIQINLNSSYETFIKNCCNLFNENISLIKIGALFVKQFCEKVKDKTEQSHPHFRTSGNSSEAGIQPCINCENLRKKIANLRIQSNSMLDTQELEISNLKSRYYSKCLSLEYSQKELSSLNKILLCNETELKKLKEELERKNLVKDYCNVSTQCEEETQKHQPLPPPNFVQMCKISEMHRKLEKMNKVNLLLKEECRKKDKLINSLKDSYSRSMPLNSHRSVLEDRTNSDTQS